MLYRLIYRSKGDATSDDLSEILAASRRNNGTLGVTGVLFHKRPHFVQVLEGSRDVLSKLFLRIAADPRHEDVTLLDVRAIGQRVFPEWAMADLSVIMLSGQAWRRIGSANFEPEVMTAESMLSFIARLAGELAAKEGRKLAV